MTPRFQLPTLHPSSIVLLAVWAVAVLRPDALVHTITGPFLGWPAVDWTVYQGAAAVGWKPELYSELTGVSACDACYYRYSPAAVPLFALLAPMGETAWRLLHVLALPLLGWQLAITVALSWPFWADVASGNLLTFVLIASVAAIRGNRLGIGAVFVLALLMPRPVILPLVAWLLWNRPEWRRPFVGLFAIHALVVLLSGVGANWIEALLAEAMETEVFNVAPSFWFGGWWLLIGIPLAVWLWFKDHPGAAGLAMSPYLMPYYLLFAFTWVPETSNREGRNKPEGADAPGQLYRRFRVGRRPVEVQS